MSDEFTEDINEYFQFTPLASLAPVSQIVESFCVPKIIAPLITDDDKLRCLLPEQQGTDHVLANILKYAKKTKGQICMRSPLHALSTRQKPVNDIPDVLKTLIETYARETSGTMLVSTGDSYESHNHSTESKDQVIVSSQHVENRNVEVPANKRPGQGLPDSPTKVKKSKLSDVHSAKQDDESRLVRDQRSEQAIVLDATQSFLDHIIEVEENLEHDTSDRSSEIRTNLLFKADTSENCLTLETTSKLFGYLRKVNSMGILHRLEKDSLQKTQKILLRTVSIFNAQNLKELEKDLSNAAIETEWLRIINNALNAMTSSSCITCILNSVRIDKELLAEEHLLTVVDCLSNILDDLCLRWIAESTTSSNPALEKHKYQTDLLLQSAATLLSSISKLFDNVDITEVIVARIVFMAITIVFADSSGRGNKILSHLIAENLKAQAVALLQNIFERFPDHRRFVLDEVLSSLTKLPANRQVARQFRLGNGKSIQLASGLLMSLVQSCAVGSLSAIDSIESTNELKQATLTPMMAAPVEENSDAKNAFSPILQAVASKFALAEQTARYIVHFFIDKSMKSLQMNTMEDVPFKALLDVFIEDFITVLHLPEWPASEIMLRRLVNSMIVLLDDSKQGTQVKASAVEALCSVACKIRGMLQALQHPHDDLSSAASSMLAKAARFHFDANISTAQLSDLNTLHRVLLGYLVAPSRPHGTYRAAFEYNFVAWVNILLKHAEEIGKTSPQSQRLFLESATSITNFHNQNSNDCTASPNQISDELASKIYQHLLSFSALLHLFELILSRLLATMDHSQIMLRTKTLRSFARLAEIDSTILSQRSVQTQLSLRVSDSSIQVRDVAVDLLGRHIAANPLAGSQYYPVLKERILDTGLSVRKRVLKLCTELYCNNGNVPLRIDIAERFLQRLHDEEETIQDLVHKSFEIMWFGSLNGPVPEAASNFETIGFPAKQDLRSRAEVISAIAMNADEATSGSLAELFSGVDKRIKEKTSVRIIFNLLAQCLTERVITNSDDSTRISSLVALRLLAHAVPSSFADNQVVSLLPYLQYGVSKFEQEAPGHVASIYACTLPTARSNDVQFLMEVQSMLLSQLTKLPIKTLNQAVPCLCTVVALKGDFLRTAKTLKSCMSRLTALAQQGQTQMGDQAHNKQVILLLYLIGLFGRHLALADRDILHDLFGLKTNQELVLSLATCVMSFQQVEQEGSLSSIGRAALQNLGNLCINKPQVFQREDVLQHTDAIMNGTQVDSKKLLLGIYNEYLTIEQKRNDDFTKTETAQKQRSFGKRKKEREDHREIDAGILSGDTDKFAMDGISPSLMQRYLRQILNAALGIDVPVALAATILIQQIVRQGLANPRNCMPTILALETSPISKLRDPAVAMHRALSEKHESLIDSCYVDGVKRAFRYQMLVNKRTLPRTETAVLESIYNIVQQSRKGRQKFLTSLIRGLEPDLDKVDKYMEADITYAFFVCHNAALLEYSTNEEVHLILHSIDKILSTTGSSYIQVIKSGNIDSELSVHLGKVAAILCYTMLLRSQLKTLYGISEAKCQSYLPPRIGQKSETKSAIKQVNVPLCPNWSEMDAVTAPEQRIALFETLFNREDHYIKDPSSDSEKSVVHDATT